MTYSDVEHSELDVSLRLYTWVIVKWQILIYKAHSINCTCNSLTIMNQNFCTLPVETCT